MEFNASVSNIRIAPRKVRKIVDSIRGLDVAKALNQLDFVPHKAALPVAKLVRSAIANAEHNFSASADNLFVQTIMVNGGPVYKRFMPRSQGRAFGILKRTSEIKVVLAEKNPVKGSKKFAAKKVNAPETVKLSEFTKMEAAKKDAEKEEKKNMPHDHATHAKKDMSKPSEVSGATPAKRSFFRRKGDA